VSSGVGFAQEDIQGTWFADSPSAPQHKVHRHKKEERVYISAGMLSCICLISFLLFVLRVYRPPLRGTLSDTSISHVRPVFTVNQGP
jgi:hypothetical protein